MNFCVEFVRESCTYMPVYDHRFKVAIKEEKIRDLESQLLEYRNASSINYDWCPCCKQGWHAVANNIKLQEEIRQIKKNQTLDVPHETTEQETGFTPDWTSPPFDTVIDILKERGLSQDDARELLGMSADYWGVLVTGEAPISTSMALKLSNVFGSTHYFWMKREYQYRKALAKLEDNHD